MAVLVTRPHPDGETTAAALRERGFEVLSAPMLRFEPVAFQDDADTRYGAVIVTSANALRGIEPHLESSRLLKLPLFAVGEQTAAAARRVGFTNVISAKGDSAALREAVVASAKAKEIKKAGPLLYLAGADLARDLSGELGERGFTVVTQTTYRMVPWTACRMRFARPLPPTRWKRCCIIPGAAPALSSRRCGRRALKFPLWRSRNVACPIAVASIVRDNGAMQVMVAKSTDEKRLLKLPDRALRS